MRGSSGQIITIFQAGKNNKKHMRTHLLDNCPQLESTSKLISSLDVFLLKLYINIIYSRPKNELLKKGEIWGNVAYKGCTNGKHQGSRHVSTVHANHLMAQRPLRHAPSFWTCLTLYCFGGHKPSIFIKMDRILIDVHLLHFEATSFNFNLKLLISKHCSEQVATDYTSVKRLYQPRRVVAELGCPGMTPNHGHGTHTCSSHLNNLRYVIYNYADHIYLHYRSF